MSSRYQHQLLKFVVRLRGLFVRPESRRTFEIRRPISEVRSSSRRRRTTKFVGTKLSKFVGARDEQANRRASWFVGSEKSYELRKFIGTNRRALKVRPRCLELDWLSSRGELQAQYIFPSDRSILVTTHFNSISMVSSLQIFRENILVSDSTRVREIQRELSEEEQQSYLRENRSDSCSRVTKAALTYG